MRRSLAAWLLQTCLLSSQALGAEYVYKPLEPVGTDRKKVASLDVDLYRWAERLLGPGRLVPQGQVRMRLRQSRRLAAKLLCGVALDCLAGFGQAFGARYVIAGDAAPVGRNFGLSLVVADVVAKRVIRRVSGVVPSAGRGRSRALEEIAVRLLRPDQYTGLVRLQVDVKGASVFLDGKLVGRTPMAKPLRVSCGAHALRLTHPAYHDHVRFVRVPYKAEVVIRANLKAYPVFAAKVGAKKKVVTVVKGRAPKVSYRPLPWYKKWYFVTATAVGAAVLAGLVTGLVVYYASEPSTVDRDGTTSLGEPYQPK